MHTEGLKKLATLMYDIDGEHAELLDVHKLKVVEKNGVAIEDDGAAVKGGGKADATEAP
jgi:hypothetical protein